MDITGISESTLEASLMQMQSPRVEQSESIAKMAPDLAAAQAELTDPSKDKEVTVQKRSGGSYSYKYAELSDGLAIFRAIMTKHGFSLVQPTAFLEGKMFVASQLIHKSGEWIRGYFPIPCINYDDAKELGGGLTYARRYGGFAIFGIAPPDNDALPPGDKPAPRSQPASTSAPAKKGHPKGGAPHKLVVGNTYPNDMEPPATIVIDKVAVARSKPDAEKQWTRYDITTGGGLVVKTFSQTTGDMAVAAAGTGEEYHLRFKRVKFGNNEANDVVVLEPASVDSEAHGPPDNDGRGPGDDEPTMNDW